MAAKRRKPKTRHGATQPEEERDNKAVLLRMPPAELARLDRLRLDRGMKRSAYVIRLVRVADGVNPEED